MSQDAANAIARAGTWSIGAGGATLTLALDPGRDFAVLNLVSSANRRWTVGTAPDTFLVLDGGCEIFDVGAGEWKRLLVPNLALTSMTQRGLKLESGTLFIEGYYLDHDYDRTFSRAIYLAFQGEHFEGMWRLLDESLALCAALSAESGTRVVGEPIQARKK